jgi:glycosyltransferase involved in cell wall biosynthesis
VVQIVPWREFKPDSLRAKLGYFSLKPRSIIDTYSPAMAQQIGSLLDHGNYDLVIASQIPMAAYYDQFRNVPAIFEELEIGLNTDGSSNEADRIQRFRRKASWFKLRRYLANLLDSYHAVTVASELERGLVLGSFPSLKKVHVLPNCLNMEEYKNIQVQEKPNTLIFTGSFRYLANYQAMTWFITKVFPQVLKVIPTTQLIITGDHANLPLPSRLKILEAMAIGIPVVATSKGAEGLDAISGKHLFVQDTPDEFAASIIALLTDPILRNSMAISGQRLIGEKYDWGIHIPEFLSFINQTVQ